MKKNITPLILVCFLNCICYTVCFFAQCAQMPKLYVVTEELPPYQIYNKDGSIGGYSTDIVKALLAKTQVENKIKMMSWARAYNTALHRKNVLLYSVTRTPERQDKFYWIGDILEEKVCYWSLADNEKIQGNKTLTEEDLKKGIMVDTRLSVTSSYLKAKGFKKVYLTSNDIQSMEMLLARRADYILTTEYYLEIVTKQLNIDMNRFTRIVPDFMLSSPLSIAVSKKTDIGLVEKLQAAFKQVKASGLIEQSIKKWKIEELSPRC